MIWVIGGKGMLGSEISSMLMKHKIEHITTDKEIDICNYIDLNDFAFENKPDLIINCSGYTDVDKAEEEIDSAYALNSEGVLNIAEISRDLDIPLIHISTDYVFNGKSEKPLNENENADPLGIYGKSKLSGEQEIERICDKYFIIRTAWLYGKYGRNFVYTILDIVENRDSLKVVNDQVGSPTWTKDLSDLIFHIAVSNDKQYGIYHFTGEGSCSWYEFAKTIYREGRESGILNSECNIEPCTTEMFPTKARRPLYSILSKEKVKKNYGYSVNNWEESLKSFIKDLKNEYK